MSEEDKIITVSAYELDKMENFAKEQFDKFSSKAKYSWDDTEVAPYATAAAQSILALAAVYEMRAKLKEQDAVSDASKLRPNSIKSVKMQSS